MPVQEQTPYIKYVANGVTQTFSTEFDCESKDQLVVMLNGEEPVFTSWSYADKQVTFLIAPVADTVVELKRQSKLNRTTDYQSFNHTLNYRALNSDFDRIWYAIQEQNFKAGQYDYDYNFVLTQVRPINTGGTGANNASDARNNLDVHSKAEVLALVQTGGAGEVLSIESGGTGGMTVEAARANLDVYSKSEVASRVGLPIGNIRWFNGSRSQIEDGEIALDGTTVLKRADYPELWAYIQAYQHVITDAEWVATPLKRSAFSSGDGSTTFRLADMNGKYTNSLRSPVLRGDGYYPSGIALGDAIREIEGHTNYMSYVDSPESQFEGKPSLSGAFYAGAVKGYTVQGAAWANPNSGNSQKPLAFKASLVVPTANENRPNSIFGVYVIKAMGVTQAKPNEGQYPTLTGGNTWNGGQSMTDLTVSGGFNANIKPLLNATGSLPIYALRTWGVIKGTSNPASLVTGVNVASVIDDGIGQYRIVFSTPMPTLNYAILIGTTTYSEADKGTYGAVRMNTKTLNGFSILCGGQSTADIPEISFGVILP